MTEKTAVAIDTVQESVSATSKAAIAASVLEEDRMRAELYDFLAALLARPPDRKLLRRTSQLEGDDTELGKAINVLARIAKTTKPHAAELEYNALFIGLGRGELLPYASYYMTGFLNEKPLAVLRKELPALRIERAPDVYEPEDMIASLCEMMAGLITGRFGLVEPLDRQGEFFNKHISPWAEHFFSDLERAKNSVFYAPVGTIGRLFVEIERQAFRMTAG